MTRPFDRASLMRTADWLAVAVAASLPWSTSATGILIVLWLAAVIPALDWRELKEIMSTSAGGLPVALVLFGALGMLWADVSFAERSGGFTSFAKLLVIPLLLVEFRHSNRGRCVLAGFLISCTILLLVSSAIFVWPNLWWPLMFPGVPVKNAATQSGEFVTCMFGLLYLAADGFERRRWRWTAGALALALAMLANMFYVSTGRTALAVIPLLLVLFAFRKLSHKGAALLFAAAIVVAIVGWFSSPYLRTRTTTVWTDLQSYKATDDRNSSGERMEFWKKSIGFVREAPLIGHGTGSIHSLFIESAKGQSGAAASATTNPHNQTFAVAIQLGIVGAILLWAMWLAHGLLFRGNGLAEWVGLVIVVQNVAGSLFNSHLFDFVQGWIYVIGVGVAGGMALKNRARPAEPS
jgi:O-antigen ligase